jgi:uncharacterized protein (TIGR02302 family)
MPRLFSKAMPTTDTYPLRLKWAVRGAHLGLIWQKFAPVCVLFISIVLFWLMLSCAGFWFAVPVNMRGVAQGLMLGSVLLGIGLLLWELVKKPWPTREQAWRALDDTSAHTPARSLHDHLSMGQEDALTRQLWSFHQADARQRAIRLTPRWPQVNMGAVDPYALRSVLIVGALGALIVAGSEWKVRLASAFISPDRLVHAQAFRLDGWIDPPAYTRLSPIVLNLGAASDIQVKPREKPSVYRVPINSTVLVRVAGEPAKEANITLVASEGITSIERNTKTPSTPTATKSTSALREYRYQLTQNGTLTIAAKRFWGIGAADVTLAFEIIPDQPPVMEWKGPPERSSRGGLGLSYQVKDDYGITSLEAVFAPMTLEALSKARLSPPRVVMNVPSITPDEISKSVLDLAEHPWAGAHVKLTLIAKDEAGQEGASETITLTLPQRSFTKPMPKALVALRRDLILDREADKKVLSVLHALQQSPELFATSASEYLGLRVASLRLEEASDDEEVISVADLLWEMAVRIEDGDLSDSEKALKAAQEALSQALQNGASPQEIQKLTQELRRAMDRYLKDILAQHRLKNPSPTSQKAGDPTSKNQTITSEQLSQMLKRIEELTQSGQMVEAQKLLEELRTIMNNMRTASPSKSRSPQSEAAQNALKELGKLQKNQENLRDETHQLDQNSRRRPDDTENDEDLAELQDQEMQEGGQERGEPRQGMLKPLSPYPSPMAPQNRPKSSSPENKTLDSQAQGELAQRQEGLGKQLDDVAKRLSDQGIPISPDLKGAMEAMKNAQQNLQKGQNPDALGDQGEALSALNKAQKALREQMQAQGEGEGEGEGEEKTSQEEGSGEERTSQTERGDSKNDPLGRTRRSRQGKRTSDAGRSSQWP